MSSFRVLHYSCLASNRICHFVCSRRSIFWRNDKYRINIWRERERRQYLLLCLHHASCNVRYWGHQTITSRLTVQGNHDDRQPLARRCNLFRYDFVLLCLTAVNWAEGSNESLLSRACWLWINFRQTFVPSGDSEKKFTKERDSVLGFKLLCPPYIHQCYMILNEEVLLGLLRLLFFTSKPEAHIWLLTIFYSFSR